MIVFEDADVEGVVDWMMTGILLGSGQVIISLLKISLTCHITFILET